MQVTRTWSGSAVSASFGTALSGALSVYLTSSASGLSAQLDARLDASCTW